MLMSTSPPRSPHEVLSVRDARILICIKKNNGEGYTSVYFGIGRKNPITCQTITEPAGLIRFVAG